MSSSTPFPPCLESRLSPHSKRPTRLAQEILGDDVRTVQQQGWGLGNGELLRRAADAGFEVFLTADRNLQFQQNLVRSPLRVIVLAASSNALEDLLPLVPSILRSIPDAHPGQVRRVDS
jgi:hypothetical protein